MSTSFNATSFPVGRTPNSIAVADIDGDGNVDIITGGTITPAGTFIPTEGGISTILGSRTTPGSFDAPITSSGQFGSANDIALADFNNDGKLDVITVGSLSGVTSNDVFVALGDGKGKFTPSTSQILGSSPQAVAVGDLNKDGRVDAVTANGGGNTVSVLLGDGSGKFSSTTSVTVDGNPGAVALRDFNGDGVLDLATVTTSGSYSSRTGKLSVLLGNGAGGFAASPAFPTIDLGDVSYGASDLAFADFNGDGGVDIAAVASGTITILLAGGSQRYTPVFKTEQNANSVQTGDFNLDGRLDLAIASNTFGSGNSVKVLLGNGQGGFSRPTSFPPSGSFNADVIASDFNKDSKLDLAAVSSSFTDTAVLLNNTTQTDAIAQGVTDGFEPVGYIDASSEQSGSITVDLGKGNFVLNGPNRITRSTQGVDEIIGTIRNDEIKGNGKKNLLNGYSGDDELIGGNSDDRLVGGSGNDDMEGGKGKDRYIFSATPNYPEGLETRYSKALVGVDTIADFELGKDKIVLDTGTFTALTSGKKITFNIVDTVAEAKLAKGIITYIQDKGNLYYNINGAKNGFGGGGKFAEVEDGLALRAKDFATFL